MKTPLPTRLLIALGLLAGLLMGYFFSGSLPGNPIAGTSTPAVILTPSQVKTPVLVPTSTITLTPPPQPYVTLPGAWLVQFHLFRSGPPVIDEPVRVSEGRLTSLVAGENKIQILDKMDEVIYEQTFHVEFLSGDPPQPVDEITQIFVLPVIESAKTIVIITPQGETRRDFPAP
jgi:hypothetical protein